MNTIKLNIGLENNKARFHSQVELRVWMFFNDLKISRQQTGEYNGKPERTSVFLTSSKKSVETILKTVEILTELFTQDCIAVKINDVGYLVYNPEYTGEKFEFNNEYFIEP